MNIPTDYKNTLNLPKTTFPMKANLSTKEPETLKFWEKIDLYNKIRIKNKGREKFVLPDGPPYANGNIHIGHALNKVLKDLVLKSKNLSGYDAAFIPCWDCHGLPIEHQVEKKTGKPGIKIEFKDFRQKCREYAKKQIEIQKKSFIRLGFLADWNNNKSTMDYDYEANIIRTFAKIIENGHLQKGEKPVHWCVNCGSALAEAEVEYKDKISCSIYVLFTVKKIESFSRKFHIDQNKLNNNLAVVIWTTTPWTLPANEAVSINAKLTYVILNLNNNNYIIAEDLMEEFVNIINVDVADNLVKNKPTILGKCLGKELEHELLQHPFYEKQVPVILGDHVTTDAGTGCVHTAPAHGADDFIVCNKYNIKTHNPVNDNGCFYDEVKLFAGEHVYKVNDKIISLLKDKKKLLYSAELSHSFPHCWRHKTPLIFRATPQWFIAMDKNGLRKKALDQIKIVEWIPASGQNRIEKMIADRPDWCVSRQRTWGTPLALFIHNKTKEIHPNAVQLMEKVANKVEQAGIEAWYELDASELLGEDHKEYTKSMDTIDVWFDSGALHYCVLDKHADLQFPANLFLEGSDQHRGWFQSSLLSSVATKNVAPYKQVLTHGFTVDAKGHKMSKSVGNIIAPEDVFKTLGADIFRLWVAAADYKQDLNASNEIFTRVSDSYRRIRNTFRFLLSNLNEFNPSTDLISGGKMLHLDKWIVSQAKVLQQEVIDAYNKYQFSQVYQKIHNFCITELGSFYLDVIKDRQYTCKKDSNARLSCQSALYYITESLVRCVSPILSFTAEEIWQCMPETNYGKREESVFLTSWYDNWPSLNNLELDNTYWQQILQLRGEVNIALEQSRKDGILGSGLEAEIIINCDDKWYDLLSKLKDELRFVLITSQAKIVNNLQDGFSLVINKAEYNKCERCWHRRKDVDQDSNYSGICNRCIENITIGENRIYA